MPDSSPARLRTATFDDVTTLLALWAAGYDPADPPGVDWRPAARDWFAGVVDDRTLAHFPVIEIDGQIAATAVGTLELGVPNPLCPRGRVVRLANVITVPAHRGRGYATRLVDSTIAWARSVNADRVDLSTSAAARRIYERAGFVLTSAPRMKLVLA